MEKKSILIIEDSSYLADSLVDMITLSGHTPLVAETGREGVQQALDEHPDLILLDIRLPDIDGYEVYRRIRHDTWGQQANIMVLTASESTENISKNINLDRELILFKPEWSIKDLLAKIKDQLEK